MSKYASRLQELASKSFYIRLEYEEGEEAFYDTLGPFTAKEAEREYESLKKEWDYPISQGCAAVYYCDKKGNPARIPAREPLKEGRGYSGYASRSVAGKTGRNQPISLLGRKGSDLYGKTVVDEYYPFMTEKILDELGDVMGKIPGKDGSISERQIVDTDLTIIKFSKDPLKKQFGGERNLSATIYLKRPKTTLLNDPRLWKQTLCRAITNGLAEWHDEYFDKPSLDWMINNDNCRWIDDKTYYVSFTLLDKSRDETFSAEQAEPEKPKFVLHKKSEEVAE